MKKLLILSLLVILTFSLFLSCKTKEEEGNLEKTLKLAACFSTPIEEPWPTVIHQACLKASKEYGIQYDMTENIGYTDFEKVVREYCERGYNIITGDAFGNEEVVRRVAKDYPQINFIFGSGLGPVEPNFAVFDDWIHEPAYLCGLLAGKLTKRNIIGIVAQIDIPEINRLANAFIVGVKEVNPNAKVLGSYIGSFWDPVKTKETALAIIDNGADVIYSMIYGGIDAAKERNILAFGNMTDQWELAPDLVVTGPLWDMYPTIKAVIEAVKGGYFTAMDYREYSMMRKGGAYLAPYHNFETKLPQEIKDMIKKKTEDIINGVYVVPVDEQSARFDKYFK